MRGRDANVMVSEFRADSIRALVQYAIVCWAAALAWPALATWCPDTWGAGGAVVAVATAGMAAPPSSATLAARPAILAMRRARGLLPARVGCPC
jgi:hypothetical protein